MHGRETEEQVRIMRVDKLQDEEGAKPSPSIQYTLCVVSHHTSRHEYFSVNKVRMKQKREPRERLGRGETITSILTTDFSTGRF